MGGVRLLLIAAVAASLCIAEGRPQSSDQRSETFAIKPFSQSDRRNGNDGAQQSSSQPVRPFSQADAREEARDNSQGLPVRPFSQPNQREGVQESLPVRPFNQYDSRGGSSQRVVAPPASQPIRPFSQSESSSSKTSERGDRAQGRQTSQRREEDLYQSRAHSAPLNPTITLQSDQERQQQRHHHHTLQASGSSSQDNRRKDEAPNWSTGQVRLDERQGQSGAGVGDGRVGQHSSTTPLQRDNRRTNPQEQKGKAGSRGQQGGADRGTSVRMGTVEVPAGEVVEKGKSESTAEEGIVFPGPTRDGSVTPGKFAPHVGAGRPNCAKGSTFCESTDNYPSEYLKTVLKNQVEGLKEFFGNDLLLNESTLVQRIDSVDENPLCQSVEQVVYPKMAQNKEEKWLYVVNQDQYIQGVRVEKCLKPESECLLTKSFPFGYKTTCRQKYIYRRMLALNDDGKALSDTFRLPSCCSCYVKSLSGAERKR